MRSFFAEMNLTLETRSVSISSFLEKLIEQGSLYKLTLIKNKLSPDLADNILISTGREEQTFIRPTFQQVWLGKMYGIFQKADATGIIEIPEGEDFDDIAIQFKLGGATRTVRLSNLDRVSIIEDIPESIVKERNVDKIIQYMIQTANAYKERMVWGDSSEV